MEVKDILSVLFGLVAVIGVVGAFTNRWTTKKGIGAQFIRLIALVVSLPLAGALAFQGLVTEAVVSLLLGILGYIFSGHSRES